MMAHGYCGSDMSKQLEDLRYIPSHKHTSEDVGTFCLADRRERRDSLCPLHRRWKSRTCQAPRYYKSHDLQHRRCGIRTWHTLSTPPCLQPLVKCHSMPDSLAPPPLLSICSLSLSSWVKPLVARLLGFLISRCLERGPVQQRAPSARSGTSPCHGM